ncbi:MAG: 50S ribosomal protein L21 [Bdellovibrionales bacterium]
MYAIIKSGGKQYTVKPGDIVRVEKLEAELGAELTLKEVLLVGGEKTFVGETMGSAAVTVVVTNQQRGPKVVIFKKKRRQGYRRTGGHRQPYTEIFVKSITSPEGQTENAETKPIVFSAEKKAQKLAKSAEVREAHKAKRRAGGDEAEAAAPAKKAKAPAKKTAKKAGAKKTAGKKATARKKPVKKGAAKKTAKK